MKMIPTNYLKMIQMFSTGREKKFCGHKEESSDLSDVSWCMVIMRSDWINKPPAHVMDKTGNTTAKMNYYALLEEFKQEEIKNCEVSLAGAGSSGFNHTNALHVMNTKRQ